MTKKQIQAVQEQLDTPATDVVQRGVTRGELLVPWEFFDRANVERDMKQLKIPDGVLLIRSSSREPEETVIYRPFGGQP